MDRRLTVGGPSTVASLAGYAIGTTAAYHGRAVTVTGPVVGLHALALAEIDTARRDLLAFRKLAWPTREAVGVLARGDAGDGVPRARDAGLLPRAGLPPSAPVATTRSLGGRPRITWYE